MEVPATPDARDSCLDGVLRVDRQATHLPAGGDVYPPWRRRIAIGVLRWFLRQPQRLSDFATVDGNRSDRGSRVLTRGRLTRIAKEDGKSGQHLEIIFPRRPNWVVSEAGLQQDHEIMCLVKAHAVRLQATFQVLLDALLGMEAGRIVVWAFPSPVLTPGRNVVTLSFLDPLLNDFVHTGPFHPPEWHV